MIKVIKWIVYVLAGGVLLLMLSIPLINDYSAKQVEKDLCNLPLPEESMYVDSVSKAGKLVGNGNGMQYFGAVLIKSNLSLEALEDFYSEYRKTEWECLVEVYKGQEIDVIEHCSLKFSEEVTSSENYYIVYSWGESLHPFDSLMDFDLRGH